MGGGVKQPNKCKIYLAMQLRLICSKFPENFNRILFAGKK